MTSPDLSKIPLPTAGQARRGRPTKTKPTGKKLFTVENAAQQGGGRKKGSVGGVQLERMLRMDGAAAELLRQMTPAELNRMAPVEVLEMSMRIYLRIGDIDKASKLAEALAPYTAPKLQATAFVTEDGLRALSKQDLQRLISVARTVDGDASDG